MPILETKKEDLDIIGRLTADELSQLLKRAKAEGLKMKKKEESQPITAADRTQALPLSFAQQRLWFLDQLEQNAGRAYHMPGGIKLTGVLDTVALKAALDRIVDRHEVLRTTFTQQDGVPRQVIAPSGSGFFLLEHDLGGRSESELERLVAEEADTPFDLSKGPLIRGRLIRLCDTAHILLVTMHHIVSDGWSLGVLINELSALYLAFSKGQDDPLPPLAVQYADYAVWQRKWIEGKVLQDQLAFWMDRLEGAPALLELPADRPRPAVQDYKGAVAGFVLDARLTQDLKALSRRHGTTLFMTLLAGWAALLSRLSHRSDIVIGAPMANRTHSEIEPLIGFFVNTLALRVDLAGRPSVSELLARVKQLTIEAQSHADIPFEQVVEAAEPVRSLSHSPLFQVIFAWQNNFEGRSEPEGLELEGIKIPHTTTHFDLYLTMEDAGSGMAGELEYATQLFEQGTIERYLDYYQTLLRAMASQVSCKQDSCKVDQLPILSQAERRQVLFDWNATEAEYPKDKCIHDLFEAQVEKTPDAVAVVCQDRRMTYQELNQQANRLARHLIGLGLKPYDCAAVVLPRSVELVMAELAVLKCGATYVPLDPDYPSERLAFILLDARVRAVITDPETEGCLPSPETVGQPDIVYVNDPRLGTGSGSNPALHPDNQVPAYVMYTSGSTGAPKGVVVPQGGVIRLVINNRYADFSAADRVAFAANPAFDATTMEVWAPLLNGGSIVVIEQQVLLDPMCFAQTLKDQQVTVLWLTVGLFNQYAGMLTRVMAQLRYLIVGGDALDPKVIKHVLDACPPKHLLNGYGPTETTTFAITHDVCNVEKNTSHIPLGRPIANTRIYILDGNHRPVPVGVTGEIYIGGVGVARGYLNRPELTAERFLPDPFTKATGHAPDPRIYRTGDLGRWLPDGTIEFMGRNDFQVKIRGYRIELSEIEAALAAKDGVKEAIVLAREDEPGDRHLVAYVTLEELRSNLPELQSEQVASWQAIYDNMYAQSDENGPLLDFSGWVSSYSGQSIAAEQMVEWHENALDKIRSLRPSRVLEIGCGSGLLLLELAPQCVQYVGTDFSRETLSRLQKKVTRQGLGNVALFQGMADNFDAWTENSFDTVILNSVIQYFPDADYLLRVIDGALKVLSPHGRLFIGDIRHLSLLEAFHASVELYRCGDQSNIAELRHKIHQAMSTEEELLVAPRFFFNLRKAYGRVGSIEILPKLGHHHNELSKFRYEAIIHVDAIAEPYSGLVQDWAKSRSSLKELKERFATQAPDNLVLTNIANARTVPDCLLCDALHGEVLSPGASIDDLRRHLRENLVGRVSLDPQELVETAQSMGYQVTLSWIGSDRQGAYHACFRKNTTDDNMPCFPENVIRAGMRTEQAGRTTNTPLVHKMRGKIGHDLREALAVSLPKYMVPAHILLLDAMPLTPNGKLDRKALPAPMGDGDVFRARAYEAPQGEAEQILAAIWAELLQFEKIGRHDNFFELGGHSLLAVTLNSRMRGQGLHADVRTLFTTPVLCELAAAVSGGPRQAPIEVPPNRIPADCKHISPDMLPLVDLTRTDIERIAHAVPGGVGNIADIYPLAPLQEGILFHYLMARQTDVFLSYFIMAFDTRKRLDGFIEALQMVLDRHDMLRTAVLWEQLPEPVQVVWRKAALPVEEVVLNGDKAEEKLHKYIDTRRHRINVRKAPLLRACVGEDKAQGRWLLGLLIHHLVNDHISREVIVEEVRAHLAGEQRHLPKPLAYRNFIAQARYGVSRKEHEAFFHQMLSTVDEPTAPLGMLDVHGDGSDIAKARMALDSTQSLRLRERARQMGVSVASLCHLAWARVLSLLTGREEVVFGTVLFGRMQGVEGIDKAIGMFINALPVRLVAGDAPVEQAVRATHSLLTRLLHHEHASLSLAQRSSSVKPPAPLFTALLNYRYTHGGDDAYANESVWQGVEILYREDLNNFPFTLVVDDFGEDFGLTAQVKEPIDPMRICRYMHTALVHLMDALEKTPQTSVRAIELMGQAELRQVLYEWNATEAAYPKGKCLHQLFEAQVRKTPDAVAVVHEEKRLTYQALNRQANRLAHHLISLGVGPDTLAAICVERSLEMVVGLLAILKAGGAYVPLDTAYPAQRLAFMLEDCAPVALLAQRSLKERLPDLPRHVACIELDAEPKAWAKRSTVNPKPGRLKLTPDHLAYVIYTSGSTGTPKAVAIEHRNAVNFIRWAQREFTADDYRQSLFATSINFDLAVYECFAPLAQGGALNLVANPLALIEQPLDVTLINTVPSAMAQLVGTCSVPASTRVVNLAGEALKRGLVEEIFSGSSVQTVCNLYGPSETTTYSSWIAMSREQGFAAHIGRPIANTRFYILDGNQQPVPAGVTGELYIGGAGVARGYLNRPELTAERFLPDPFAKTTGHEPDPRMYRTGDLGRWLPDGHIEFLGRNDFQVKIRGYRIEPGEIEARLCETEGLKEAVVLAAQDAAFDTLIAYYTGSDELGAETLRSRLLSALPEYMVPAAYVHLEALPLTVNGKLDRKALPAPEGGAFGARAYEAPKGELEQTLAAIWAELLQVETIGRRDHFFELGGHSLLAIQMVGMLEQAGIDVQVAALLNHPTIERLAAYTKEESDALPHGDLPIRREGADTPLL